LIDSACNIHSRHPAAAIAILGRLMERTLWTMACASCGHRDLCLADDLHQSTAEITGSICDTEHPHTIRIDNKSAPRLNTKTGQFTSGIKGELMNTIRFAQAGCYWSELATNSNCVSVTPPRPAFAADLLGMD